MPATPSQARRSSPNSVRRAGREVSTPRVDVLAEERDLPDAVPRERFDLRDDLARSTALLPPPHRRHDAVGALRVAAHRHLHPRAEATLAMHRKRCRERVVGSESSPWNGVAACLDPLAEVRDRAGAERDVDERVQLEDPFALRLGIAAAHGDDEIGMPPLSRSRVAEIRRELRVGLLPDRARVEDEDVCLLRLRDLTETERLEHALDPLRVVSVHLAAERRNVVPAHRRSVPGKCGPSGARGARSLGKWEDRSMPIHGLNRTATSCSSAGSTPPQTDVRSRRRSARRLWCATAVAPLTSRPRPPATRGSRSPSPGRDTRADPRSAGRSRTRAAPSPRR